MSLISRLRIFAVVFFTSTILGAAILGNPFGLQTAAEADPCTPYSSENAMINAPSFCRHTFVLDPGQGNLMSRGTLLEHASLYVGKGWDRNFLWYSHETTMGIPSTGGPTWSFCAHPFRRIGQTCHPDDIREGASVSATFGPATTIHVFEFAGAFIGRACGNYSPGRPTPTPKISGIKFHDKDRDGNRDAAEPSLSGWRIRLFRETSLVGQTTGFIDSKLTNSDGFYQFDLLNQGPGLYYLTEDEQDGWDRTTPERRYVFVNFGVGDHNFGGNDFGNVENHTDVVKVSFNVLNPPEELRADKESELVVRAVLRNLGPASPVDVEETIGAFGPPDCIVRPERQSVILTLETGRDEVVDFTFKVACTEPSFHKFEFENEVKTLTPGVTDDNPSNNFKSAEVVIPVIDTSDIQVLNVGLTCPPRADVADTFTCVISTVLANAGPHGIAITDASFTLTVPSDCATEPGGEQILQDVEIPVGLPKQLATEWEITCSLRSFHPLGASVEASIDHLHVEDPDSTNNNGSIGETVPIFEPVDLRISGMRIFCGERHFNTLNFTCTVTTSVMNDGPANGVATLTEVALFGPIDCVLDPTGAQFQHLTLDAGQTVTFSKSWNSTCASGSRHVFDAVSTIRANEPHAEDRDLANNTLERKWVPPDIKPRSFPSSINLNKQGLVPVAILSTPQFNAPEATDQSTLRFGRTGFEESFKSCGEPEDVNDDGLLDLVCHFEAEKTGFMCGDTVGILTGKLKDGTGFEGQDDVNIVPCPKS